MKLLNRINLGWDMWEQRQLHRYFAPPHMMYDSSTGHIAKNATSHHLAAAACCCSQGTENCCYGNEAQPDGVRFLQYQCVYDNSGCTSSVCGLSTTIHPGFYVEINVPDTVEWAQQTGVTWGTGQPCVCWITTAKVSITHKEWNFFSCDAGTTPGCPGSDDTLSTNRTGPYYVTLKNNGGNWLIGYHENADTCCVLNDGGGNETDCWDTTTRCSGTDIYDDCCDTDGDETCCVSAGAPYYNKRHTDFLVSFRDNYCCQCDADADECVPTSDSTLTCPGAASDTTICSTAQDDDCPP